MVAIFIGAAVVALLATTSVLLAPKIPVYEFAVRYPPVLWFGDTWNELKTTLYAHLRIQNDNLIQSDVFAASFDLFFPTWDGDFVQIGHVEDKFQQEPNYSTPTEAFWKLKPKDLFETRDHVILRMKLTNICKVLTHLLYQMYRGNGILHVMSTGVTHITTPPSNVKFTLTFVCDTKLNAITSKMVGHNCAVDELSPGRWGNMSTISTKMRDYAVTLHPNPVNGTVLVRGKPQRKIPKLE